MKDYLFAHLPRRWRFLLYFRYERELMGNIKVYIFSYQHKISFDINNEDDENSHVPLIYILCPSFLVE